MTIQSTSIETNGQTLAALECGEGPLVLLLHGFPESSHSWRHQLPALGAAGYRVVAPDQRGYGASSAPHPVEDYNQPSLVADAIGILDTLGESSAVVVGHDWGAPVAYNCALMHPDRVRAVAGLSVPFGGRPRSSPLAKLEEIFKDVFFYMLYFQQPGKAEAELEADVRRSLRMFYYSASGDAELGSAFSPKPKSAKLLDTMADTDTLPGWLTEADLDVFVSQFEHSGFRGPLNWYRNFDRSWERSAQWADAKIEQPSLFLGGDRDPVIVFSARALERMPSIMTDLRGNQILEGCGHWIQQERPDEVNAALLAFLKGL